MCYYLNVSSKKSESKFKKNKKLKIKGRGAFWAGHMSGILLFIFVILLVNLAIQIYRKPAELLSVFARSEPKTIMQTWKDYKDEFQQSSTHLVSPFLLAAIAQIESGGRPLASPSWRIKINQSPLSWFSPASSSVGLYQFTLPTFEGEKKFCLKDGTVKARGPWYQFFGGCWANRFYSRLIPSHSIRLAATHWHRLSQTLFKGKRVKRRFINRAIMVAHLCGPTRAERYVRSGGQKGISKCGNHSVKAYIAKVESVIRTLKKMAKL